MHGWVAFWRDRTTRVFACMHVIEIYRHCQPTYLGDESAELIQVTLSIRCETQLTYAFVELVSSLIGILKSCSLKLH